MPPHPVGKAIFESRREYPLPKEAGTKDFIFYFVSASDPYGKGARYFFDRFFKDHERTNVGSLQELTSRLSATITSQNIEHIREIVIVAHGTPRGLIFPVVDGVTDSNLTQYKYLTPGSLAELQSDFEAGRFADFSTQRKQVVAKLTEDLWVTAFFSGRANVYAPKEYQFFGTQPSSNQTTLI